MEMRWDFNNIFESILHRLRRFQGAQSPYTWTFSTSLHIFSLFVQLVMYPHIHRMEWIKIKTHTKNDSHSTSKTDDF